MLLKDSSYFGLFPFVFVDWVAIPTRSDVHPSWFWTHLDISVAWSCFLLWHCVCWTRTKWKWFATITIWQLFTSLHKMSWQHSCPYVASLFQYPKKCLLISSQLAENTMDMEMKQTSCQQRWALQCPSRIQTMKGREILYSRGRCIDKTDLFRAPSNFCKFQKSWRMLEPKQCLVFVSSYYKKILTAFTPPFQSETLKGLLGILGAGFQSHRGANVPCCGLISLEENNWIVRWHSSYSLISKGQMHYFSCKSSWEGGGNPCKEFHCETLGVAIPVPFPGTADLLGVEEKQLV